MGFNPDLEQEEVDFEDMPSLQYIQLTIPQFCATVLEKALPLLKTNDEYITSEVFHLLHQAMEIILIVMTPDLWEDNSMAAREVVIYMHLIHFLRELDIHVCVGDAAV